MIFIPESLNEEERSSLLLSIVLPRPIAFVTSLNGMDSSTNIAPFSLFNLVSLNPPIIFISIQKTKPSKRTSINIARAKEFVVNIPNYTIAEEMNKAALPFNNKEKDKIDFCKLTKVESQRIETCGIKESLIRLECTLHSRIDLGDYEMFLGKILSIYCDNSILEDKQVAIDRHEFISRLGPKELYAKIQSSIIFKMERCVDVYKG
jgi:flavin reductase (DIM6/NTAB) family NADH-FMN oxidoreductase RutF